MRAHIAKIVKASLSKGIEMFVVPGGLTPYLQAGDIWIYKSFKDQLSTIINDWKRSDAISFTRGENPRPPTVEIVADWVSTAWCPRLGH